MKIALGGAPRCGKRSDDHPTSPQPRGRMLVVIQNGRILRGTACKIVRRLDAASNPFYQAVTQLQAL